MRLRCEATRRGKVTAGQWVEGDDADEAYGKAHEFAAMHVNDHVAVYDENGDLEFDSGPGVP